MVINKELRHCPVCNDEVMHRQRTTKHIKNDVVYARWECLPCTQKKQRAKLRENKLKGIGYLGGRCMKCGQTFEGFPSVFDFHHRDPKTKEHSPCSLLGGTWDRLKIELDKCDLLCSNCHRKEHAEDFNV